MNAVSPDTMTTLDEIIDNFSLLEEWDDRYRYVIELGRGLSPLSEQDRTDLNKVQGCASQVWLATTVRPNGPDGPALTFQGDSDAHIVRGLIAILFAMFSGKPAQDILSADAIALFERLGLREHLTPQRSNGFRSMVERIRADASAAHAGLSDFASTSFIVQTGSGRPSPRTRRLRNADERIRKGAAKLGYLRRRRCWPSPLCIARCERAAA